VARALDDAGELTGPALIRHIEQTYPHDAELIAEVRALLGPTSDSHVPVLDAGGPGAAHELARRLHDRLRTAGFFTTGGTPRSEGADVPPIATPARVGSYEIVRVIGQGGMGVVYEALQASPRRRVAIKMLSSAAPTRGALARFRQEAEVLGCLKHPGIAHVFEAASDPTHASAYFAMEFVDGAPLTAHADASKLKTSQRVELLARVCDAVQHAHQAGVIHRDLKPSNILVEPSADGIGQPKVLDFGVAKLTQEPSGPVTMSLDAGRIIGTLGYMPPEALDVSPDTPGADTRSDVYSLGVLLYELLTGRLPVEVRGTSLTEAARRIRELEPQRLETLPPGPGAELVGDLDVIARKALAKDPAQRYPSAAELAADLRRCVRHEPVLARPPSTTYAIRKFIRRRRGLSLLVGAAGAIVLAAGITTGVQYFRAERARVSESRQRGIAERRQAEAEQGQYRASLAAAESALHSGDAVRARRSLTQAPATLRGWEWNYLWRSANPGRVVDLGEPVDSAMAIPGTTLVISESRTPGRSLVWDLDSQGVRHHLPIAMPRIAADGARILGVDTSGAAVGIEPATGTPVWHRPPRDGSRWRSVLPVSLSSAPGAPARPHAVLVGSGEIVLVDSDAGSMVWSRPMDRGVVSCEPHLSTDAAAPVLFRVLHDSERPEPLELVLDARTGSPTPVVLAQVRSPTPVFTNGTGAAWALAFDPRQPFAIRRAPQDALWSCGAFNTDGSMLGVGDTRGSVHLYSINASPAAPETPHVGEPTTVLAGDGTVRGLSFAPHDSGLIVTDRTGRVCIVPIREPRRPWIVTCNDKTTPGPLSPDGSRVLTTSWGSVECHDALHGLPLWRKNTGPTHNSAVAWSPDASAVVWIGDIGGAANELFVLDGATGEQIAAISDSPVTLDPGREPAPAPWQGRVVGAAFHPSGERLFLADADAGVRVLSTRDWTLLGAPRIEPAEHIDQVTVRAFEFSADGRRLVLARSPVLGSVLTGAQGLPVVIRDGDTLEMQTSFVPPRPVCSAAWLACGNRLVLGHTGGLVSAWDAASGAMLWQADLGTTDEIGSIKLSPDGSRIIAGGSGSALHILSAGVAGDPHNIGGAVLANITMPVSELRVQGFAGPDALLIAGVRSVIVRLETDASTPGLDWTPDAIRAWPGHITRPASLAQARWLVERADALAHAQLQLAATTQERARRALAAAGEPEPVRALAAHWITTLGPQLNWTNSHALLLMRHHADEVERMQEAAAMLDEMVRVKPHSSSLRWNLASALMLAGRPGEAASHVREAERLSDARGLPIDPAQMVEAARVMINAGEPDEGRARLDRAQALLREGSIDPAALDALQRSIADLRREIPRPAK